jgi:acyl transferase domain-containing protein/NADPH:quinone reductase-like Zn-dependent oxidoreductase/NAD(P)-dependent dehydrogenase (short-subunit alcohol dehydrogenase family)/SAM-dependent methyltransferase/acyl carrier protein
MNSFSSTAPGAIAIIGMSGRFPGSPNLEALWRNLRDGVDCVSRFSEEELIASNVDPALIRNPNYVPAAAVLTDIDQFDAEFFQFTARETECMDPQHRFLLQCAWEALEQAGYAGITFDGRIGVYAGAGISHYWMRNLAPNSELLSSTSGLQLLAANAKDYVATRISYKLNLTGPSLTVSTACSTSLVAVHLACTALLDFHCDIALAGGASIQVPGKEGYVYLEGGIGSSDGCCRPFDARATGTISGSGVGVVVLRRLEDALKAGDTIHAVILGSAVNNDGADKAGFAAPSELGQAAVIAEALSTANISPDTISYIEAHGTGTPLGDPIEVAALTRVFRRHTKRRQFCALGSIKGNFGHLDEAAGIAGLIKTVLALKHHTVPPSLHFKNPNPKLDLENSPFFVNCISRDWVSESPRRAGVSSFGIGGTNVHVVLEESPPMQYEPAFRPISLLALSARTESALIAMCRDLADHLERHPDLSLADVAFTLAVGRCSFPHRYAVVCKDLSDAIAKLRSVDLPSRPAFDPSASASPVSVPHNQDLTVSKLGELWTAGGVVDWNQCFKCEKRRRVPLPTYPFENQRYWIDAPSPTRTLRSGSTRYEPEGSSEIIDSWFYVPRWAQLSKRLQKPDAEFQRARLSENDQQGIDTCAVDRPGSRTRSRSFPLVLFSDALGIADAVSADFREAGHDVLLVRPGSAFRRLNSREFVLPLEDKSACLRLWPELEGDFQARARMVLFSLIGPERPDPSISCRMYDSQFAGLIQLLTLVQSLGALVSARSLTVVTNNCQSVTGEEVTCPANALLWGAIGVVGKEYPNLEYQRIDIDLDDIERFSLAELASDLCSALVMPDTSLAIRRHQFWELLIEPLKLARTGRSKIKDRGTYLITGGLGSMGMAFAEYLAKTARARLVLVSRSPLPNWSTPVTNSPRAQSKAPGGGECLASLARTCDVEQISRAAFAESRVVPLDRYPGLESRLNRYCSSLVWEFISSGLTSVRPGSQCSLKELEARLGILPKYQRFFSLFVRLLVEDGIVRQNGDSLELTNVDIKPAAESGAYIAACFPDFVPLIEIISHCARNYSLVFSGELPWASVLYPDGTSEWLDRAMRRLPRYAWDDVYLRTAAKVSAHLLGTQANKARILEIGGGTGSLTTHFASLIASGASEYHFTDISPTFVGRAREMASQSGLQSNMRFSTFDVSSDPVRQGMCAESYDLVVGYNVVHATPDLVQTLRYLHSMLVPGGILMLVETIYAPRWVHLIWGLTEGWWSFSDLHRRQRSPLVSLDQWKEVASESGFVEVTVYPQKHRTDLSVDEVSPQFRSLPLVQDAGLIIAEKATHHVASDAATGTTRPPDQVAQICSRIEKMEAAGAEVCVLAADISDAEQVTQVVQKANQRFGPIDGVIHTAGVLGQMLIRDHNPGEIGRVLAPKVDGTVHLVSSLRAQPLSFFILCSSLSAIEPIPGQFAYSAANCFLDAFAHAQRKKSPALTVAINWGFWQELGMIESAHIPDAVKKATLADIQATNGSNRGIEIFARIMESDVPPQLLVSPGSLPQKPTLKETVVHPILRECDRENGHLVFSGAITAGVDWLIDEHQVSGQRVLPGTAYLDLVVTAFWHCYGPGAVEFTDVCFLMPMVFAPDEERQIRLVIEENTAQATPRTPLSADGPINAERPRLNAKHRFRIVSLLPSGLWQEHAMGQVGEVSETVYAQEPPLTKLIPQDVDQSDKSNTTSSISGEFWERVETFSPHWKNITHVALSEQQGTANLKLSSELMQDFDRFAVHPALFDTATGFLAYRACYDGFLPFSFRQITVFDRLPAQCVSIFNLLPSASPDTQMLSGSIADLAGNEIIRVEDYTLRRVATRAETVHPATEANQVAPENVQLEIRSPGQRRTLVYRPVVRQCPGEKQIEIEIRASGLNFVEILYALGMLPNFSGRRVTFGQECAGVVSRVGDGVDRFKPGDEVIAYGPACFGWYTILDATSVALKPFSLSFEEAATLPAAYLTAWYSLIYLARLSPGERVLIHAAAGGVGTAAVRIAQWRGAEIFATAGSPKKRQFLREIGVTHVMDSRSLRFEEEIRHQTNGEGVDVVLNSLNGEFIHKSLALLRRHGRFLELGKRDIFSNSELGLGVFSKQIAFFAVDIGPDMPGFSDAWNDLALSWQKGTFTALPHRVFPAAKAEEAFAHFAQARHIGKLVLSFPDTNGICTLLRKETPGLQWEEIISPPGPRADATASAHLGSGKRNFYVPSVTTNLSVEDLSSSPTSLPLVENKLTEELAKHERPLLATDFRPPQTKIEKTIASVWEDLLGVAPIGIEDDFFELKGDSLLVAQVMSRLYRMFEIKMPLSLIFDYPTIKALAAQIASRLSSPLPENTETANLEEGAI